MCTLRNKNEKGKKIQKIASVFEKKEIVIKDLEKIKELKIIEANMIIDLRDLKEKVLNLPELIQIKGKLLLPKELEWLIIKNVKQISNLVLNEDLIGLKAYSLTCANGLVLNENLQWFYANGLNTTNGLILNENLQYLFLENLTSFKGLNLNENLKAITIFSSTTIKDLLLNKNLKAISVPNLEKAEFENVFEKIPFDCTLYTNFGSFEKKENQEEK